MGRRIIWCQLRSGQKEKKENLQQRREIFGEGKKKDKALLRINTPIKKKKKNQGRRMPAGSGYKEE